MMRILHIGSSPMLQVSSSRKLSQALIDAICQRYPDVTVIARDLGRNPPPHLREETFLALTGKIEASNEQTRKEVSDIYDAIRELNECDVLVIGAPMINHSVSSALKTWIDQVCQARMTFRFTVEGAQGLVKDKPTFIVSTRGGVYSSEENRAMDHQESYLISTLKLMGIEDVHVLPAEGVDKTHPGREQAEKGALAQIPDLLSYVFNKSIR
ncbi:NAD(P)H-dependent oxidoreductase [Enterobacteriaceae bacterium G50]|nr:NAD(P)H-dependent oxidoreductase [Enterobacteriaceae bacterium G50]